MAESKVGGSLGHWGHYSVYGPYIPLADYFFTEFAICGRGQFVETFLSLPVCTVTRVFSPEADQWSPNYWWSEKEGMSPLSLRSHDITPG